MMRFESDPAYEVGIRFEKMQVAQNRLELNRVATELLLSTTCFVLEPDQEVLAEFSDEPDPTHAALLAALNKVQSRSGEDIRWGTYYGTLVGGQDTGFCTDFGLPGSSRMIVDQKFTPFDGELTLVTANSKVGHVSPDEASHLMLLLARGKTDERYAQEFQRIKMDASNGVRVVYTSVVQGQEGEADHHLLQDFRATTTDSLEGLGRSPEGAIKYIGSLSTFTSVVQ